MKFDSAAFSSVLQRSAGYAGRYRRFLIPAMLVVIARAVGSLLLFNILHMDSAQTFWMSANGIANPQNAVLGSLAAQGAKWPFLYLGWDSSWYLSIATKGYAFLDQSYAFFPGLPLFSAVLNFGLNNPAVSLILVSSAAGILWVPVFQLVAELYADARTALRATVFYVFFPYVFLFTTVAYSEGLYMVFTLLSWCLFRKRAIVPSMLVLAVAVLARPPGLLLMLPIVGVIVYSLLRSGERMFSRWSYVLMVLPFASFFAWLAYAKVSVGDWFAIGTRTAWSGMPSFATFVFSGFHGDGFGHLFFETVYQWPYSVAWILFLLAVPPMLYFLFKMDKWLGLYSAVFLVPVLVSGGLLSLPRFISFIFPLWLALGLKVFKNERTKYALPVIAGVSLVVGMLLWLGFIQGHFIA
jgi:Gpi18-like mannosyltransferase